MMAPSCTSIPPSIRHQIYKHLLLDLNVVTWSENHVSGEALRPMYAVSLFTVNQNISDEIPRYFYTRNAFIKLKSNVPSLFRGFQAYIPAKVNDNGWEYQKYVLKMTYTERKPESGSFDTERQFMLL
jgi:hypothetical protein